MTVPSSAQDQNEEDDSLTKHFSKWFGHICCWGEETTKQQGADEDGEDEPDAFMEQTVQLDPVKRARPATDSMKAGALPVHAAQFPGSDTLSQRSLNDDSLELSQPGASGTWNSFQSIPSVMPRDISGPPVLIDLGGGKGPINGDFTTTFKSIDVLDLTAFQGCGGVGSGTTFSPGGGCHWSTARGQTFVCPSGVPLGQTRCSSNLGVASVSPSSPEEIAKAPSHRWNNAHGVGNSIDPWVGRTIVTRSRVSPPATFKSPSANGLQKIPVDLTGAR